MGRRLLKYAAKLIAASILGIILVYGSMRLLGFSLTVPRERESLAIAPSTQDQHFSTFKETVGSNLKNVIMFNIAGMGINQILATRYRYYGKYGRLNMERMPIVALVNNSPLGPNLVSSPHAAAAAMAKGHKAYNGMLSPPGNEAYPTLLQQVKQSGLGTGIITNSYVTGATTAAFGSNVQSRSQQMAIAQEMIMNRIDFMVGGGNEFYKSGFDSTEITGIEYAQEHGYQVINSKKQLLETEDSLILGLFDDLYSNRYSADVSFDPDDPTFEEFVSIALRHLKKNEKGFFLLVDDEGTDFGGYSNRADYLTQHLIRMDDAIGVAIKFAQENKETLVLVCSEAEAGGMVITGGDTEEGVMTFSWGSNRHTGQMVPLFAFGPGSINFAGVIENTDIPKKILDLVQDRI